MNDNIIEKILEQEAEALLQTAFLLSEDKKQAATTLNDLLDRALSKLWQS